MWSKVRKRKREKAKMVSGLKIPRSYLSKDNGDPSYTLIFGKCYNDGHLVFSLRQIFGTLKFRHFLFIVPSYQFDAFFHVVF
jgi:hypothetical protein